MKQKTKIRPINDYKSSFVNSSVTQSETATVHTVDHIAALVSCMLRVAQPRGKELRLKSKTWDLADAYKQVPLSDAAYEMDSHLVVFCPHSQKPEVFKQRVLPFGSVAQICEFECISHTCMFTGTLMIKCSCGVLQLSHGFLEGFSCHMETGNSASGPDVVVVL